MSLPVRSIPSALALVALAALPAAAQRDRDDGSRIDTTVALGRGATVDLSLLSGEIIVHGWNRDEARVQATSERGAIAFEHSSSRLMLSTRPWRGGTGDTRYELSVPVGTRLILRAISGDIRADGVGGEVEAHSTSGDVTVTDASSRITLESISGDVRGEKLRGTVRVNSVSGDVTLQGVDGDVDAQTVSGDVDISDATTKWVRAESTSGDVGYGGSVDPAGRYDFTTHSGEVSLTLPSSAGGVLSIETFSGSVDSDFPITIQPTGDRHSRPRRMEFSFGNGNARISVETFSGDIRIEKR